MFIEPGLRRSSGATREPQDSVPYCGHDGAGQTDHHEGEAG